MKRYLSLLIALIMVMSTGTMAFAETTDYENSWAKDEINYMREKGILQGDQNGNFKPNNQIRKSEFYRVINGLIGYQGKSENVFSDVKSSDWFFEEVQKGLEAKYLSAGELLNARDNITREEVARIIAFVFDVEEDKKAADFFEDSNLIKEELKGIIGGLKANGFINGFPDKTFRPTVEIKRADVVKMLYDISGEIINKAGTFSKDVKNNIIVNTEDVVLKDMTIGGNLYLTEGIGEGDVTLDNVTVKGEVIVKGGGANSVIIKNSIINKIRVDKPQGLVRVVFENTTVKEVKTARQVKLELTKGTKIEEVKLDGKIEVVAEKGTSIETIDVVSKEVTITSKGNIGTITTTQDIKVNDKEVKAKEEAKVEDGKAPEITKEVPVAKPTAPTTPTTPTTGGSTGGSGGGGGGGYIPSEPGTPTPPTPRPELKVESVTAVNENGKDKVVAKLNGETNRGNVRDSYSFFRKVDKGNFEKIDTGKGSQIPDGVYVTKEEGKTIWTVKIIPIDATDNEQTVIYAVSVNDSQKKLAEKPIIVKAKAKEKEMVRTINVRGNNTVVNGQTLQLGVTVGPKEASNKAVTWSVTTLEGGEATIDQNGLLTPSAAGTVTVTATAQDGSGVSKEFVVTITAKPLGEAKLIVESSLGLPTSKVTVEIDGKLIKEYTLYFDGSELATSNAEGVVIVVPGVVKDLTRVQIGYNSERYTTFK